MEWVKVYIINVYKIRCKVVAVAVTNEAFSGVSARSTAFLLPNVMLLWIMNLTSFRFIAVEVFSFNHHTESKTCTPFYEGKKSNVLCPFCSVTGTSEQLWYRYNIILLYTIQYFCNYRQSWGGSGGVQLFLRCRCLIINSYDYKTTDCHSDGQIDPLLLYRT